MTKRDLLEELMQQGVLKTARLHQAFETIDRADFIPASAHKHAYDNIPLPIGAGQTISQPYTVAFTLTLLDPQPGDTVLDIGSGSGWQTALLAQLVSPNGKVIALELAPSLYHQSLKNIAPYNFLESKTVEIYNQSAEEGFPQNGPFDRIVAAAAVDEIPKAWKEQLKIGGIIVAPVSHAIVKLTKTSQEEFQQETHPGFAFVPFVKDKH